MAINYKFDLNRPTAKESSIIFRFDLKGKRFKYGTGQTINPELWKLSIQRATTDKKITAAYQKSLPQIKIELLNINQRLENIISVTNKYFALKEQQQETASLTELKTYLDTAFKPLKETIKPKDVETPDPKPKAPYIKDLIHQYVKGMYSGKKQTKTTNRDNYSNETIQTYLSLLKMWEEMETHYNKKYLVTDISGNFEDELYFFFNEIKKYFPNTKGTKIKILKVVLFDFLQNESDKIYNDQKKGIDTALTAIDLMHIEKQLNRIKKPSSKAIVVALDKEDLKSIYNLKLDHRPNLDCARDIFLVGCYTGLRHSDYSRISPEHINKDFIEIIMMKTKEKASIPLCKEVIAILKKWQYTLPDMTSQELNRYVKEIGLLASIVSKVEMIDHNKKELAENSKNPTKPKYQLITTHTARRSFATNMFYDGMNSIDIMKITGHKKLETFQKYIVADPNREKQRQEKNRTPFDHYLKVV